MRKYMAITIATEILIVTNLRLTYTIFVVAIKYGLNNTNMLSGVFYMKKKQCNPSILFVWV